MTDVLLEKLVQRWPINRWQSLTIVVGCSGGADSVALARALFELKPSSTTLVLAHYNHCLRGTESDADQAFVESLASELGLICKLESAGSESIPISDESTLRDRRYDFLGRVAGEMGARYVAIAHTADDRVETTLHNLIRGTGLKGLAGIPPYRDLGSDLVLIRPIIDVWRSEVEAYLQQRNQSFRQDSSNQKDDYTRNRIRNQLIPLIVENFNAQAKQSIHRTSLIVEEAHDTLDDLGQSWLNEAIECQSLEMAKLKRPAPTRLSWPVLQLALKSLWKQKSWPLQAMSNNHWAMIRDVWENPTRDTTSIELPGKIKLSLLADYWYFERTTGASERV
jgi:tRNA(Ile)-lysidine synthase